MSENSPRRRFIAGAVCPRCALMDKIVVDLDTDQRHCVSCGFSEARPQQTDATVAKATGSQAREVMMTLAEYEAICAQMQADENAGYADMAEPEPEEPAYASEGQREFMATESSEDDAEDEEGVEVEDEMDEDGEDVEGDEEEYEIVDEDEDAEEEEEEEEETGKESDDLKEVPEEEEEFEYEYEFE